MRRGSPALTWAEEWRLDFLSTGGGSLIEALSPCNLCHAGQTSRLCIYLRFLSLLENTELLLPTHSHGKQSSKPKPQSISSFTGFFLNAFLFFVHAACLFCLPFPQACSASHKTWFCRHTLATGWRARIKQQWLGEVLHASSNWVLPAHTRSDSINLFIFVQRSSTHMLPHTISPESSKVLQNFFNAMATASLHIPQAYVIIACLWWKACDLPIW